ncbi:MAG TPA: hypothetical protein VD997_05515 [Phycisphaerales bacterium]|nr:hypothetical protein [Phycisphaerales bacterium]
MNDTQNMARQSVRYDVSIRGSAAVAGEHQDNIRFGAGAGARDGWVDLDIVDFSSNGIGMISPVFIPRRTLLTVRAYSYGEEPRVILEVPVRVQRVCMTDRRPAYLIGTAFADPGPDASKQVAALLALLADDTRAEGAAA